MVYFENKMATYEANTLILCSCLCDVLDCFFLNSLRAEKDLDANTVEELKHE